MRFAVRPCGRFGVTIGLLTLWIAQPPAVSAAWTRSFRLAGPEPADVSAPRLAVAASGSLAVSYSLYNEDVAASSQAYVVVRAPGGATGRPRAVPGAQQVLDLAYNRSTLELLTGGAPSGQGCCSYARAVSLGGRRFGRPRTVVDGLTGFTLGRLIAAGSGHLLAAVATELGVWAAQSGGGDRFAPARRLSTAERSPWTLAATILPSARTFIGWTEADPQPGSPGPGSVMLAVGSISAVPQSSRTAFSVPRGHEVDELALAPGTSEPLLAWIESWFAADGSYRTQAVVADLGAHPRARPFPHPGMVISDIAASGDGSGENVVVWKACDQAASCSVWATFRRAGGQFASPSRLGSVDTAQAPAAAFGGGGRALVGWVDQGRVWAAERGRGDARFSASRSVAASNLSHDLTMGVTPDGSVIAVWTEGTLHPSVTGAYYRFG